MIKWLVWLIVLTVAFLGLADTAKADTASGYTNWTVPSGTVCVQTSSHMVATSAGYWSVMTDARLTVKSRCTGYARSMTVGFKSFNDPAGRWCARFTGGGYTWKSVRDQWAWTPKAPTIEVNMATARISGCRANARMFIHVMVHELGHFLGLDHNHNDSIMCNKTAGCSWKHYKPAPVDVWRVNRKF